MAKYEGNRKESGGSTRGSSFGKKEYSGTGSKFKKEGFSDRPKRDFKSSGGFGGGSSSEGRFKKPYENRGDASDRPKRDFKSSGGFGGGSSSEGRFKKPYENRGDSSDRPKRDFKSSGGFGGGSSSEGRFKKPYENRGDSSDRPKRDFKSSGGFGGGSSSEGRFKKPYENRGDSSDRPKRDFKSSGGFGGGSSSEGRFKKPYESRGDSSDRPKRDFKSSGGFGGGSSSEGRFKKPYESRGDASDRPKRDFKSSGGFGGGSSSEGRFKKPYENRGDASDRPKRDFYTDKNEGSSDFRRPFGEYGAPRKSFGDRQQGENRLERKPFRKNEGDNAEPSVRFEKKRDSEPSSYKTKEDKPRFTEKNIGRKPKLFGKQKETFADKNEIEVKNKYKEREPEAIEEEGIRLNRYIANSGVCSRREADILIQDGMIKVNGKVVDTLGYVVKPGDSVKYGNKVLNREKMAYVLLNKPKDFLTTTTDPQERGTVMELVKNACKERIYPVGRLDRSTTGLLLLTNDGELTEKLTHPSHNIKKIYQVELNRPISVDDANAILDGLYFEEGKAVVDSMAVLDGERMTIGIEIHIGWNRIIRRIFEAKGYDVVKLDRMLYAGLTKKDLPRGHWRHLTEKEVVMLKHFS